MTTAEETTKKGRKYDQVLEGAREIFLRDGFEGASVDDIARAAGVSKATLYSYFADKRLLFVEVAKCECCRQSDTALSNIDVSSPVPVVLEAAGRHLLEFILSDIGLAIFRVCVAESDRFPEVGQIFYDSGPGLVHRELVIFLTMAKERGELEIDDIPLAADQFAELCKAGVCQKRTFGLIHDAPPEEITRVIKGAVETFMARYAA